MWRLLCPIENNLAAAAAVHCFKTLFKVTIVEPVSYHRGEVKTCLNHCAHLVPSFEHFPAVNALNIETLEDYLVPVNNSAGAGDAEKSNLAAAWSG